MFRVLDGLAFRWATGDLPEEYRFFLNTPLTFWKKGTYDDDEWIQSPTEAKNNHG